jgi:hypothetical protein
MENQPMRKTDKFPTYKSRQRIHSLSEYHFRASVDKAIHDDVTDFLLKRDVSVERFVEMLISDSFIHRRITDPTYPS